MFASENGKLIELPEDIRMGDEYKIYDNVIVIYYAKKRTYSIYTKTDEGLHLEIEELKSEPKFFESGFILADSYGANVLYNTKRGTVVATGIKVNTKITKKGKIKFTNLDNFLLYRIVKVFYFI